MTEVGDRQFFHQCSGPVGGTGVAQQQFILFKRQRLTGQHRQYNFQGFPPVEGRDDDAEDRGHKWVPWRGGRVVSPLRTISKKR